MRTRIFALTCAALTLLSGAAMATPEAPTKGAPAPVPVPIASPMRAAVPIPVASPASTQVAAITTAQPAIMSSQPAESPDAGATKPVRIYWFLSGR